GPDMRALLGLPPEPPTPPAEAIQLPPTPSRPRVSVIIPTYGQLDHTLRCLASFAAAPPGIPCELIVVDDASPDARAAELAAVQGIRLVRNSSSTTTPR
nr:glycosyltransferase [Rubritepida sp.]